ncbi:MAG: TonB-dependent receptor [Saprospiraceae bacterium]|nr:TonB-dependent receptor [Saprospiraceae bacterium]
MKSLYPILFLVSFCIQSAIAQSDSLKSMQLESVDILGNKATSTVVKTLPTVYGTTITAGKKNAVIDVQELPTNLASKNGHHLFAKVPGAMVYDMDGAGNQINVAVRGLDPHRSWELNIRQDGILTNSDMYGYPASHYSMPMEAIGRIEMLSGASSLSYGAQFGGMLNYITKQADTTRRLGGENITTVGSYGLVSNYTSVGGKIGQSKYFGYYFRRRTDGYRTSAQSTSEAAYLKWERPLSNTLNVSASLARSTYRYRIPGPLTDSMFYADPRQSTRSRSWFSPDIYIPSVQLAWSPNAKTFVTFTSSAVLGNRSSVQFIGFANVADAIDPLSKDYKNRQVDIDNFNSYTQELRLRRNYHIKNIKSTLTAGVQLMNNDLHRRQLGKGTTGSDYDLTIAGDWGRDLHFKTKNVALFVENLLELTPKWLLTLGSRYENGVSDMTGKINYLSSENIPLSIEHHFPLLGASIQYQINKQNRLFGGFSQSYRPVIFADIIPPTVLDRTDPNLKDAYGYNAELGLDGHSQTGWHYSLTLFQILYMNRIGTIVKDDGTGKSLIYKTNTGNSLTRGAELYTEYQYPLSNHALISAFTATSFFDGFYKKGNVIVNNVNTDIAGNKLETVPTWMSRNGVKWSFYKLAISAQWSYVGSSYSDALNTVIPSSNGARGYVPAYNLLDLALNYRLNAQIRVNFGMNNVFDTQYFTKRPTGYPGVGVWSSDGRNVFATLKVLF